MPMREFSVHEKEREHPVIFQIHQSVQETVSPIITDKGLLFSTTEQELLKFPQSIYFCHDSRCSPFYFLTHLLLEVTLSS